MLGSFGCRFIADELPGRGISAGENKAARLCSQQRMWSTFATATVPDRTWLTDITEHPNRGGQALPPCDQRRRVAGYSTHARLAVSALRNALGVERLVEREATNFQCHQCFRRYPPCCLCR